MRILDKEFVEKFRTINTHPALLPNFPGAHAVRDALAAGAKETGTTVHWVDEGLIRVQSLNNVKFRLSQVIMKKLSMNALRLRNANSLLRRYRNLLIVEPNSGSETNSSRSY